VTDPEHTAHRPEPFLRAGQYVSNGMIPAQVPEVADDQDEESRARAEIAAAEQALLNNVRVAEGTFRFGTVINANAEFKLRHPEEWFDRELAPMEAGLGFLNKAWGYVYAAEAIDIVRRLEELLYRKRPDGARAVLFEAPFDRWVQREGPLHVAAEFQKAYSAGEPGSVLRDDLDVFGTEMRLAYCNGRPFVILVGAERGDKSGTRRRIEAVRIETPEMVERVVNEFSLSERLRVNHLLDRLGVDEAQRREALTYADRTTVQRDDDVRYLLNHLNPSAMRGRVQHAFARIMGKTTVAADAAPPEPQPQQPDETPGRGGKHRPSR